MPAIKVSKNWWTAQKGQAHKQTLPYVRTVENYQAELFDKFVKEEALYDTNPRTNRHTWGQNLTSRMGRARSIITENIVATNVDAVAAQVSATDIRAQVPTDGADWSHQRTAKRLELYIDGLSKLYDVGSKCRTAFKAGAALKGTGLIKVWVDQFDAIRLAVVPIDNIVVDELECRDGNPRQLHYRDFFDREDLQAQFPEYADEIERAQGTGNWRLWAGYRPMQTNEVVVIESWRLPIGPPGHERRIPGRHTLTIDGCDLLDEEYEDDYYPFAKMVWNAPSWGYYGISLAERILPHQNLLNRRNYQINRSLDLKADPVTYVHQADQNLAVKTVNQLGSIAVYKHAIPATVDHQAVGKETYDDVNRIKASAAAQTGVNQMAAQGGTPPGLETGEAVREARNTASGPFAIQEKAFEKLWLDTLWLILSCCKKLGGTKAPEILKVSKYGNARIKWSEVELDDLRIELQAASTLANTPAARQQRVTELAQAGVITLDESRALMDHPDIDSVLSLYNAAVEDIDYTIERILDGEQGIVPEPYQNLKIGTWRVQQTYLRVNKAERDGGAPEEIIEALADWMSIAANILNPQAPPTPGPSLQDAMPGAPPQMGGPPGPPGMPGPGGQPMLPQPVGPLPIGGNAAGAFAPGSYAPMTA